MSSVDSISSLLSSVLGQQTSSAGSASQTDSSETSSTDTVSLSSDAQNRLSLLKTLLNESEATTKDYVSELLSGSQSSESSSMYDVLISAENSKLVSSNPTLANMIETVNGTSNDGTSSSSSGIDLMDLSADDLMSIIDKYQSLSGTSSPDGSTTSTSSSIDEIV